MSTRTATASYTASRRSAKCRRRLAVSPSSTSAAGPALNDWFTHLTGNDIADPPEIDEAAAAGKPPESIPSSPAFQEWAREHAAARQLLDQFGMFRSHEVAFDGWKGLPESGVVINTEQGGFPVYARYDDPYGDGHMHDRASCASGSIPTGTTTTTSGRRVMADRDDRPRSSASPSTSGWSRRPLHRRPTRASAGAYAAPRPGIGGHRESRPRVTGSRRSRRHGNSSIRPPTSSTTSTGS